MSQAHTGPAYEKQMVSLGRILQSLQDAQNSNEAVQVALDHVKAEFDFEVIWIGLYDRVRHRLNTKGFQCPRGGRLVRTHLLLTPGDVLEQVVIQQRPLIVADLQSEPRAGEWRPLAKQMKIQSAVLFPIRRQNTCFGILLLGSTRWGLTPSAGERAHLSVVMGFLAESLHQYEVEQQRLQIKQPDKPLFKLLESLSNQTGLDNRLQSIISETQNFIRPTLTRIFWFEPQGSYFWQRCCSRKPANTRGTQSAPLQIPVEEVRGFFKALSNDQLIVLGEAQSSLKVTVTDRMLQLLKANSLIAAPILAQGAVRGFLTVEGDSPRMWHEVEKRFLQGASRLVGLASPLAEAEDIVSEMQLNQELTAGIVQGIYRDADWRRVLQRCSEQICERLSAQQFLVLLFDHDLGGYELCFHSQKGKNRGAPLTWPALDDVDWQMLKRASGAVAIEDMGYDLKLMAWRSHLQSLEAQALLSCNVAPGSAPEGVVIVADHNSRHWKPLETALIETVSRQIGLILHQWQLQRQMNQQEHIYESIQWGLHTLQKTFKLDELERSATEHIAKRLQAPLVALVVWPVGQEKAQISQVRIQESSFWADIEKIIPVHLDAIINWALQTDGILPLSLEDLPDVSRQWISGPADSRLMITALRTAPHHAPAGVLVVMAPPERRWTEYHMQVLALMANQLAWSRRHLNLVELLANQQEQLKQINWYKQQQFQETHRFLSKQVGRLSELSARDASTKGQRYQEIVHQLESLLQSLAFSLQAEQWQLVEQYHTAPLVSLLNRLLERANPLIQQQQLWTKVHNETNLSVGGDIAKVEFILYELMVSACSRSQTGGQIDIWCRQLDRDWIEISITDNGQMQPQLIEELSKGRPDDWLAPSTLTDPPGLHFAICTTLMARLGGELTLSRLEDNRNLSRILLPIARMNSDNHRQGKRSKLPSRRIH